MYIKLLVSGNIRVLTGMHIGGGNEFSAIGAIDSPVIKDPLSKLPIIPGSSLKGKLRTLLARQLNKNPNAKHNEDCEQIQRLFGSKDKSTRLIFTDACLANKDDLLRHGAFSDTEIKFENTISRTTGEANPRQIERSISGSVYPLSIVYQYVEKEYSEKEILEDISNLSLAMILLQFDYLGGHGSRGYGKVKFEDLNITPILSYVDENLIQKCEEKLKEV